MSLMQSRHFSHISIQAFKPLSFLKLAVFALSLITLVACSGGGDTSKSNEPNTQQNGATDITAPTISSINPANNATIGTASNKRPSISVTFSESVQNVNATNVVLKQGTNPVAVSITGSGASYSITPNADLASNQPYSLEFKAGISDVAGNALVAVSKSYTTDWVAPTISSLTPADNATDVSVKPSISLNFSETVTGVNATNVLLSKSNNGSNPVALTASGTGSSYSFTLSKLDYDTEYFIVIKAANIKDTANNALGSSNQVTSFRTYKQTVSFSAWVGTNNTLLDINGSLPNNSELYSYRSTNYNDCNIASITSCTHGQTLLLNGQTITNPAHTLANTAFYKLKEGSFTSTGSSENTSRFSARYFHQAVWFKNKLWVIGGNASPLTNDVWSSIDGVNWTQATANAGFSARYGHQVVVANIDGSEKLWLIGGLDGSGRKNDVWSSTDGVNWTQATVNAGFSARYQHQVVAANIDGSEKLWLIGGYDGSSKNDVWSSANGSTWSESTISGSRFSARSNHQVVVSTIGGSKKLWLIGGYGGGTSWKNDIWSSANGSTWSESTINGSHFSARYGHQVVVANIGGSEKLWLIGGNDDFSSSKNDVWSSANGSTWSESTIIGSHFTARYRHQVVVSTIGGSQKLWLIGGDGGGYKNDVWRSADGAIWRKAYLGEITRP